MTTELQQLAQQVKRRLAVGWTKEAWARDEQHQPVEQNSSAAVCWCLGGAITLESHDIPERSRIRGRMRHQIRQLAGMGVVEFNDTAASIEEINRVLDQIE